MRLFSLGVHVGAVLKQRACRTGVDWKVSVCVRAGNVEEEFNKGFILPPLIVQLRKILDQYPDDTQILRVSSRVSQI